MIDPPTASEVPPLTVSPEPPLPHLTGEKVPPGVRIRTEWSDRVLNAAVILFGFAIVIRGPELIGFYRGNFNSIAFTLMIGTCMIASGLYGFLKLAKQREENAGE